MSDSETGKGSSPVATPEDVIKALANTPPVTGHLNVVVGCKALHDITEGTDNVTLEDGDQLESKG